jgi:hypothetical protein
LEELNPSYNSIHARKQEARTDEAMNQTGNLEFSWNFYNLMVFTPNGAVAELPRSLGGVGGVALFGDPRGECLK